MVELVVSTKIRECVHRTLRFVLRTIFRMGKIPKNRIFVKTILSPDDTIPKVFVCSIRIVFDAGQWPAPRVGKSPLSSDGRWKTILLAWRYCVGIVSPVKS